MSMLIIQESGWREVDLRQSHYLMGRLSRRGYEIRWRTQEQGPEGD